MDYKSFKIVFWISSILIIYIYCGYPLFLFFISNLFKSIKNKYKVQFFPSVTIFIPVYNEESVIKQKIKNMLSLDYPSELLELVIASDGSTDRTDEILKFYKKKGITLFFNGRNEGKNSIINKFIPLTNGEIIVFTDANAMFSHDALKYVVQHFLDPSVGCVSGRLKYLKGQSAISKGEGLYFRYENSLKKMEGFRGKMVVANGAIYAMRRKLFNPVPLHVPNDFFHPLSVLRRGFSSIFEEKAIALEKPSELPKEEFNRRTRIVTRSFGTLVEVNKIYGVFKGKGWFYIISHKILRWFAFPIILTIFISNIFLVHEPFYKITFFLQILFYFLGIIGYIFDILGVKINLFLYTPYYFLLINIAGFIGIIKYFKGNKIITWNSASTTR